MPTIDAARLEALCATVLGAAGVSSAAAHSVAAHLVENDLKGVESHGCSRIPSYLRLIAERTINAKAEPSCEAVAGAQVFKVDGRGGFGIPAMERALEALSQSVEDTALAAAGIVNVGHTGRIGAYAEQAAERGCFAFICGGGNHRVWPSVAPYGGRRGVVATNPYALALPGGDQGPLVVDFATSAAAQGKIMVARDKGAALPEGLILDRKGRPSTDPNDFYDGGALLPAAGPKGSGLALIAELIGEALLGPPHELNWLFVMMKVEAFRELGAYGADAEAFLARVRACPPQEGFERVSLPGELERERAAQRRQDGIVIDEMIWDGIAQAARKVGIDLTVSGLTP
jgi:LDH2 family malate/lactate/ureidoglycolate dehydrogenase